MTKNKTKKYIDMKIDNAMYRNPHLLNKVDNVLKKEGFYSFFDTL